MTERKFVKPAEGMTVLDPDRGNAALPAYGAGVAWNSHWQRRLDEAEIEMTTEAKVAAGEKAADAGAADKPEGGKK